MGKVIFGMTVSLDGFIQDEQGNFGMLYQDFEAFHESELLVEAMATTGAVVMGRRTFDRGNGDYTGYEYQVPLYILTHNPPTEVTKGQNENLKVIFVEDGIESAIAQAKAAAGDKDVQIVGGADTGFQVFSKGLVDELSLGIMPIFLGQGLHLFDQPEFASVKLEKTRILEAGQRTDIKFRVIK